MKSYLWAFLLPLLAAPAPAQVEPGVKPGVKPGVTPGVTPEVKTSVRIDEAMLKRVVAEVFPAIKKETGVDPAEVVRLRLAEPKELGDIVQKDMMQMAKLKDGDKVPGKIRVAARSMRRMLLAKFDWREREILFCPDNFRLQAKMLKNAQVNSEATFRAVLVHECVHAVDEQQGISWA